MPVMMADLKAGRVDLAEMVDLAGVAGGAVHPGEHVRDWLGETGTAAHALAKAMGVPGNRLLAILAGRRAITADTALRLGAATGTSAEMWLGLQSAYDLEVARGRGVGADVRRVAV
jgi:addiction module HigA family antidote